MIAPSRRKSSASPSFSLVRRDGVEGLLVEEVGAFAVAVEIGGLDGLEVRLLELVAGLEGLVEDGAGEQVAHLEANQGLAAARGGGGDFHVEAVVGCVFKLEVHLALDFDGVNQCGHGLILAAWKRGKRGTQDAPVTEFDLQPRCGNPQEFQRQGLPGLRV